MFNTTHNDLTGIATRVLKEHSKLVNQVAQSRYMIGKLEAFIKSKAKNKTQKTILGESYTNESAKKRIEFETESLLYTNTFEHLLRGLIEDTLELRSSTNAAKESGRPQLRLVKS